MKVATLNPEHPMIKFRVRQHPLVHVLDDGQIVILTGPTPWGTGVWGPFPADCVVSLRDPMESDSWPVNGSLHERWTVASLNQSLARARVR